MTVLNPPHESCWVQTKWGRYEALVVMQMKTLDENGLEKTFVAVEFKDTMFNKLKSEEKIFEIKYIDYMSDL